MSFHENDLPDPVAVRAFTIMNGFCSLVCQDRFMVSLLVTAGRRIGEPHRMPLTSSQEVWEKPPFCQHFFHNDRFDNESRRSWIFQHDDVPVEFPMMPTYFQWTPKSYHLLRINGEDVFRRQLKLKYTSEGHDHDDNPCDCDHDLNRDVCSAYELFEYKFVSLEQSTLFCLSSDLGDSYGRNTLERLETVKNVFDGIEQHIFSPERQKMGLGDEDLQCLPRKGHGFIAGLGNQWSFNPLEFKWTLYEELFRLTSEAQLKFDAALCFQQHLHLICRKGGILLQHWADQLALHRMEHFKAKASEENSAIWGGVDPPNTGCFPYAVPLSEEGHQSFCSGSGRFFLGSQGEEGTSQRGLSANYDQVLWANYDRVLSHLNTTHCHVALQNLKGGIILPLCIQEVDFDALYESNRDFTNLKAALEEDRAGSKNKQYPLMM